MAKGGLKIVRVDWIDAYGGVLHGWRSHSEMVAREAVKAVSFGVLLRETRDALVVCPHFVGESDKLDVGTANGDGDIAIPRSWVRKVTILGRA